MGCFRSTWTAKSLQRRKYTQVSSFLPLLPANIPGRKHWKYFNFMRCTKGTWRWSHYNCITVGCLMKNPEFRRSERFYCFSWPQALQRSTNWATIWTNFQDVPGKSSNRCTKGWCVVFPWSRKKCWLDWGWVIIAIAAWWWKCVIGWV